MRTFPRPLLYQVLTGADLLHQDLKEKWFVCQEAHISMVCLICCHINKLFSPL